MSPCDTQLSVSLLQLAEILCRPVRRYHYRTVLRRESPHYATHSFSLSTSRCSSVESFFFQNLWCLHLSRVSSSWLTDWLYLCLSLSACLSLSPCSQAHSRAGSLVDSTGWDRQEANSLAEDPPEIGPCCRQIGAVHKVLHAIFGQFWPPPSPVTLCHISREGRDPPESTSHISKPPIFIRPSTKTRTKAPCTNSLSIVRRGFCPEFFVRVSFVWKFLSGVVFDHSPFCRNTSVTT